MAPQDTTVIFTPGSFHVPECFDSVIANLHNAGYKTSKVNMPSVLRDGGTPTPDISQDVAEIRKHITEAVEAGQKVVLVMHSYSGVPGTDAADGFDQASLAAQGHADGRGIVHLLYLASFMLQMGESLASVMSASLDWIEIREDTSVIATAAAGKVFYNDFESQAEVDRWVAKLQPWSIMCMMSPVAHSPWKKIPATCLSCKKDNATPLDTQKNQINRAIAAGAIDLKVIEWDCGHTPFGVKPLEVSQLIRRVAGEILSESGEQIAAQVEVSTSEIVL